MDGKEILLKESEQELMRLRELHSKESEYKRVALILFRNCTNINFVKQLQEKYSWLND